MKESLVILLSAIVIDLYLGDPVYRFHPVRLFGDLITTLEKMLEKWPGLSVITGFFLFIIVQVIPLAILYGIEIVLSPYSILVFIYLVYSCISIQDLIKHGKKVLACLESDNLSEARQAVQMLIGRDAQYLDKHGVARAAVESMAENFVDGFLAPLFWFCIGSLSFSKLGLPSTLGGTGFILFYKVTNTLDSMVGYKNERYLKFGKFSAKLDDVLNFLPARLSIPVLTVAARMCKLNWKKAWKIGISDRLKHTSPNAAHSEAAVAGALNIRLNGPGIYPHGKVEKPWVGEGTSEVTPLHLSQSFYLILTSAVLATAFFASLMAIL